MLQVCALHLPRRRLHREFSICSDVAATGLESAVQDEGGSHQSAAQSSAAACLVVCLCMCASALRCLPPHLAIAASWQQQQHRLLAAVVARSPHLSKS